MLLCAKLDGDFVLPLPRGFIDLESSVGRTCVG